MFSWPPFSALPEAENRTEIVRAKGALLYTKEGHTLIDAIASWWVNIHGHGHPRLAKVLHEQALRVAHVIFSSCSHPWAETLAQRLIHTYPHPLSRVFYSDNGSTAVEVALKLSLQYHQNMGDTSRRLVIALEGAYHGDTFGAMSMSERNIFNQPFQPWMFRVQHIPFPATPEKEDEALQQLTHIFKKENVAAFIFEPLLQGTAGMRTYSPKWLEKAMRLCHQEGVICIADEVLTGFGRTGGLFAGEKINEAPDLVALSKGLTGGLMPLGATLCAKHIVAAFEQNPPVLEKNFWHGHSYTAYPLACRIAIESLDMLEEPHAQKQFETLVKTQQNASKHFAQHPCVNQSQSIGPVLSLTLKSNHPTSYENPLKKKITDYFLKKGILIRPLGNVIYVLPPYVIKKEELHHVHQTIDDFLEVYAREKTLP